MRANVRATRSEASRGDGSTSRKQSFLVAKCNEGEHLTPDARQSGPLSWEVEGWWAARVRCGGADGGIVLELCDAIHEGLAAAAEPSDAQAGQSVGLAHPPQAHPSLVRVARRRQTRGGTVL